MRNSFGIFTTSQSEKEFPEIIKVNETTKETFN